MKAIPCVVLTRPAGASNRLKARLSRRGCQALACPTLSIETLPAVAADLAVIKQVDLVFFVSGAAVRALGDQLLKLGLSLGSQVQLAAVGQSTAAEIRRVLGRQDVILPHEGHPEDSESLWKVLVSRGELARRVLIVRGQTGRDWLTQQFQQHGQPVASTVPHPCPDRPNRSRHSLQPGHLSHHSPIAAPDRRFFLLPPDCARPMFGLRTQPAPADPADRPFPQ